MGISKESTFCSKDKTKKESKFLKSIYTLRLVNPFEKIMRDG